MSILKIYLETAKFLNFKDDTVEHFSHKKYWYLEEKSKTGNKAFLLRYKSHLVSCGELM